MCLSLICGVAFFMGKVTIRNCKWSGDDPLCEESHPNYTGEISQHLTHHYTKPSLDDCRSVAAHNSEESLGLLRMVYVHNWAKHKCGTTPEAQRILDTSVWRRYYSSVRVTTRILLRTDLAFPPLQIACKSPCQKSDRHIRVDLISLVAIPSFL